MITVKEEDNDVYLTSKDEGNLHEQTWKQSYEQARQLQSDLGNILDKMDEVRALEAKLAEAKKKLADPTAKARGASASPISPTLQEVIDGEVPPRKPVWMTDIGDDKKGTPEDVRKRVHDTILFIREMVISASPPTGNDLAEAKAKTMWALNQVPLDSPLGKLFNAAFVWLEGDVPREVVEAFLRAVQ